MKIYTVLSNHYDNFLFQYWVMTTTDIIRVNNYIEDLHNNDKDIMQFSKHHKITKVFYYEDNRDLTKSEDGRCSIKEEDHIVVIVKEV